MDADYAEAKKKKKTFPQSSKPIILEVIDGWRLASGPETYETKPLRVRTQSHREFVF